MLNISTHTHTDRRAHTHEHTHTVTHTHTHACRGARRGGEGLTRTTDHERVRTSDLSGAKAERNERHLAERVSTFHPKEIGYGLDLLARTVQIILVHLGAQVARVRVALHQVIDMRGGHIEAPAIGPIGRIDRLACQLHRLGVHVDGAGCIGCKELLPDLLYGLLDFGLWQRLHLLHRLPESARSEGDFSKG